MKVLVSGATGLVGTALTRALHARGDEVVVLTRRPEKLKDPAAGWDPMSGRLDEGALDGVEAVVHLAGESIASGRWTEAQKARIRDSRVAGTTLLAGAIAKAKTPVFVSASAVGFYGDRDDTRLDESSPAGDDFLAEVCVAWEAAAEEARRAGSRVVHPRIGIVLSADGGALEKMLLPFKLGLGGKIGSGQQYMSWIALDDVVGLLLKALDDGSLSGAVNLSAPEPVRNSDFTRALGRALGRPTFIPLPGFAAKMALGEMADALLLTSTRAVPTRALEAGYTFERPDLEDCLRGMLSGSSKD